MSKPTIVSPSGNFYGSEQVLFDYLTGTSLVCTVWVPAASILLGKLTAAGSPHHIRTFDPRRLPLLYARLLAGLATGRIRTLYLNEAGHSRFAVLLARRFPRRKFVIHVRITEDTLSSRWPAAPLPNLRLISISRYIADKLALPSELIGDPYLFGDRAVRREKKVSSVLTVGVIGRITLTKGLDKLVQLVEAAAGGEHTRHIRFILFGDASSAVEEQPMIDRLKASPAVNMTGFVSAKDKIYGGLDAVLHMSAVEPLGRIFFEAIDYGLPFVGFDAAGIGEIGHATGLLQGLVPDDAGWKDNMLRRLLQLDKEYAAFAATVGQQRTRCRELFSTEAYVRQIDKLINA